MLSPNQYREDAKAFCVLNLFRLCSEMVAWAEVGVLGEAPCFRELSEKCKLYAGVEYGRKVAENLVRHEAMRHVSEGC